MAFLVDSSVWIAAASTKNKECQTLKEAILTNELIYIAKPIQIEVCQGARTEAEFNQLWDGFLGFEVLMIDDEIWKKTSWNYFKCRKKGVTLATMDCLVATLAIANEVELWTLDKIFSQISPILGLSLKS